MLFTSGKSDVLRQLVGIRFEVNATDVSDVSYMILEQKIKQSVLFYSFRYLGVTFTINFSFGPTPIIHVVVLRTHGDGHHIFYLFTRHQAELEVVH